MHRPNQWVSYFAVIAAGAWAALSPIRVGADDLLANSNVTRTGQTNTEDWPHWMGLHGDNSWREAGIMQSFPEQGPPILWRVEIGAGYSGPSVVGDRIFVMDRVKDEGKGREVENAIRRAGQIPGLERVLCLDAGSGQVVWSHDYDCPYAIAYPTGPRCTPAVDGDHVYTLGAMGHLKCLNVSDGQVVWENDLRESYGAKPPVWGYASHPLVDGDQLLVPVGGEGSAVVAFNKQTGEELWRACSTSDVAYAPLVIYEVDGERQLIFWHADAVESLDPATGQQYWSVKFPEERNPSQTSIATPVFLGNRLLISEYYKGSLLLEVGSNPPSVTEIWRSHATDPKNERALNSLMTTPIVRDGYAWGIANDDDGNGVFRCIRLDDGEMAWSKPDWMADEPLMFGTAFIVPHADRYFMFNDLGELMIVQFDTAGYRELDRAKILEPTGVARGRRVVWSHPAFSAGRMFARNDRELVCVDLREKEGGRP